MASPFTTVWANSDRRAAFLAWVCLALLVRGVFNEVNAYEIRHQERELVRVGCDGVPQLVRVNEPVYSDPNEIEIAAFAKEFTEFFMRADSNSIEHDVQFCAQRMVPELAERYRMQMKGTKERPGAILQIQALHRRTDIDRSALEVKVDRTRFPWHAEVKGIRQVVSNTGETGERQPFELWLDFYRVSRNEVLAGLVVANVRPKGEALNTPIREIN